MSEQMPMTTPPETPIVSLQDTLLHVDNLGNSLDEHVGKLGLAVTGLSQQLQTGLFNLRKYSESIMQAFDEQEKQLEDHFNNATNLHVRLKQH